MHQVLKFSVLLRNTLATTQNTLATQQKEERNTDFLPKRGVCFQICRCMNALNEAHNKALSLASRVISQLVLAATITAAFSQTQLADPLEPLTACVLP